MTQSRWMDEQHARRRRRENLQTAFEYSLIGIGMIGGLALPVALHAIAVALGIVLAHWWGAI